jgi:hypothetical protein
MIIAVSALPADAASSHGQPFASLFRSSRLSEQATGPMSGTDAHRKARVAAKLVCLGTHMYVHTDRAIQWPLGSSLVSPTICHDSVHHAM